MKPNPMVDVEECGLEVCLDAVRDQQALDDADQRVLLACEPLVPRHVLQVAEGRHELRQRDRRDRLSLERDRARPAPARRLDLCESVQRVHVPGVREQSRTVLTLGGGEPTSRPVELAELHPRPGRRFRLVDCGIEREPHRRDGASPVAEQLASIRDACVGGKARPEPSHRVEGVESLPITTELDERVADKAVGPRRRTGERARATPQRQRPVEPMTREAQRAEAGGGEEVPRRELECAA